MATQKYRVYVEQPDGSPSPAVTAEADRAAAAAVAPLQAQAAHAQDTADQANRAAVEALGKAAPRVTVDELLSETPFYIAHRGSGDVFTEHTLEAYTGALAQGADALELSVHLTADGVPVCFHDATLDKVTGVSGDIAGYTLAELRTVQTDMRKFLGAKTPPRAIPTLESVLDAVAGKAVIFLEAKATAAQPHVLKAVEDYGIEDSVVMKMWRNGHGSLNGNAGFAAECKALGLTTWCYLSASDTQEQIASFVAGDAVDMVGVPYYENLPRAGGTSMTEAQISAVVALGKPVICWEVHRRSVRDWLVGLGVRGIMCSNWLWVAAPEKFTATTMDFRRGIRLPGMLPGGDQVAASMPAWDTTMGWLVMNQAADASFLLSPLSNNQATTYTLNVTMGWPSTPPATDGSHAGVVFAAELDEAWGFSGKHAGAAGGSYMLVWRGGTTGRVILYKYAPGATSGQMLGEIKQGPVPTAGKFQTFRIKVDPKAITISIDGMTDQIIAQDEAFRGSYVHLVKNYAASAAGDFAMSAASITP